MSTPCPILLADITPPRPQTQYKIIRVWAFADVLFVPSPNASDPNSIWYQLFDSTGVYINYGPDGLQRLDYAVSAAERHGLKLVLPFVNTWPDYGGKAVYAGALGCGETAWFTDATCQAAYKDWVRLVVERYRASKAVFAWELGNEPRCPGCNVSVIREWARGTSAMIKGLDPNHMVTMGDEGWFGPKWGYQNDTDAVDPYAYQAFDGVDFAENLLEIDTLDYGTFHLYPGLWGYPFVWGSAWIRQHDEAGAKVSRPSNFSFSFIA